MQRGFTLIEIMVSMSIFIVVMTISLGAILGIFTDNTNAQQIKAAMDNLNSGVETMSRELRFGTEWHCGDIGSDITSPQECQANSPGTEIAFLASDGVTRTVYRLNGTAIEKSVDGGVTFTPVTSNEVSISQFTLVVVGLSTGNQPKGYIYIKGVAGTKNPTPFSLQSLVSQRVLNTGIFTVTQGGSGNGGSGNTGLTFGNFDGSGPVNDNTSGPLECGIFRAPATGALSSISQLQDTSGGNWKGVLVDMSTLTIVLNGVGNATPTANGWATSTFAIAPLVTATNRYALCFIYDRFIQWAELSPVTGDDFFDASNSYNSPTDPTDGGIFDNEPTVYATYQ
jgi:prepilin-type N-terminal cleavage/methylation domain-containing protein